jgi:UDP-GlcNAc:undecaprenyl-phosphate GlcNAc-1-phosphate transferase
MRYGAVWGIIDLPSERKAHLIPIPRLGGLGIFPALSMGILFALVACEFGNSTTYSQDPMMFVNICMGLFIGVVVTFMIGAIDDFRSLRVRYKLATEILLAFCVIQFLPLPIEFCGISVAPWIAKSLIVIWLVVIPNSVNLLDGIDGLSGILLTAYLCVFSVIAMMSHEGGWLFITLPTLGAVWGFLRFNWHPAKIFLGDSGSLMLGFFVAYSSLAIALIPSSNAMAPMDSDWRFGLSLALTSIWVMDTSMAVTRRMFSDLSDFRDLKNPNLKNFKKVIVEAIARVWVPDRQHLHHKFLRWGFNVRDAALLIGAFAMGIFLMAIPIRASLQLELMTSTIKLVGVVAFAISVGVVSFITVNALRIRSRIEIISESKSRQSFMSTKVAASVAAFSASYNSVDTSPQSVLSPPQSEYWADNQNLEQDQRRPHEWQARPPTA